MFHKTKVRMLKGRQQQK